ncbi:hypothetical protein GQ53DRAFT_865400 [Thozetella sp. PMI_491]|nr:hypothetical protein GQ53DRAFT_865400 [Thozetella sp. PMI_491]
MNVSCQCGSVAFKTATPEPLAIYYCHCVQCQKQTSSAFGTSVIFPTTGIFPLSPELRDKLTLYVRPGEEVPSGRPMKCYFCNTCGSRVIHRILNQDGTEWDTLAIKGGLIEGLDWSKGVHIYTESAVMGLPDGVESYATLAPGM